VWGPHVDHPDPTPPQFATQRLVRRRERGLARRVGRHAGQRLLRHDRAERHHDTPSFRQLRHQSPEQPERTEHVGDEQLLDHVVGGVDQVAEGDHPGRQHERVEVAGALLDRAEQTVTGTRIAQVETARDAPTARAVDERRQVRCLPRGGHHRVAGVEEQSRNLSAEDPAGADHRHDPPRGRIVVGVRDAHGPSLRPWRPAHQPGGGRIHA